jgi:hypothetical protein
MPGNLLHGNLSIPEVSGDDTQKDIKTILNYLYQLQEQLRYTMRNIGEENFNAAELDRLAVKITGGAGFAQINAKVDDMGATLNLLSAYTGLNEVVTVDSAEDMTDDSKTYRIGDKYYKHNGAEWVEDTNIVTAAITLAAINGQSAIKIKADNIDFTGHTTFARVSDIGELDENDKTIIFGNRIKTGTLYATALAASASDGYSYIAMRNGLNFRNTSVMPFTDSNYDPRDRTMLGLFGLAFHGDTKLSATGKGTTGNAPTAQSVASLNVSQSQSGTVSQWGFDIGSRTVLRLNARSWGTVAGDDYDSVELNSINPAASNIPNGTIRFTINVQGNGIAAYKYEKVASGWSQTGQSVILS